MIPILTRFGSSFLFSYTVVLGLGVILGFALTYWLADERQPQWWDGWLIAMVCAWLSGRLTFIWLNWDYYGLRPLEIGQLWQLGQTYQGALWAGLLGLGGWCWWRKRPFYDYAALFAPALVLIMAFGWAACWAEGCAYGRETTLGFFAADLPDEFGVFAVRYQTQLMGVVLSMGLFTAVLFSRNRVSTAVLFWFTILCLSLIQLALTLWRGDNVPLLGHFRIYTLLNLLLVLISLILLQYELKK
jgi:phosphatidylglycerol:prolipoprotein diacylglycerol transferase